MTLSQKLSHYFCGIDISENDASTIENVKSRIVDYIAVTSAAGRYSDIPAKLEAYAAALHGHTNYPVTTASFLNAAKAHCLDYDDGHLWAGIHAAGPVIGTAFALASKFKPRGKLFLEAIIAGYEVEYRLGKALGKSHIQKGFHGSCTCGVIGAVVTAGKLIGLDEKQLAYAMGLAGLAASGYRQALSEGQMSKPVQVGYAAERGVAAALMAKEGMEAPLQIFEGDKGLFLVLSDEPRQKIVEECVADLGARHLIDDTYTKLFPCCRYTHAAIEASFKLRNAISNIEDIKEITVNTFDIAIEATAPNKEPKSIGEARFSMNYLLAVGLHQGFVGVDDFTEAAIDRDDIRKTAKKVRAYSTKEWNDVYPNIRGAEIIIEKNDGSKYLQKVDRLSGMSGDHEEVRKKYFNACKNIFTNRHAVEVSDYVEKIDKISDVSELVVLCGYRN